MRRMFLTGVMAFTLSAPLYASESSERLSANAGAITHGLVQEQDVSLVFDYLREAMTAALEGREVSPPEALVRRAEAVGDEMKRRGIALGRAVLDAIELSLRERIKQPRLPPSSPLQRTGN